MKSPMKAFSIVAFAIAAMLLLQQSAYSQTRIYVADTMFINHKMMGDPKLLFNEQDSLELDANGNPNQLKKPAGCGQWWTLPHGQRKCFIGEDAPTVPDIPNQPWPANVTIDLARQYNITDVYAYVQNYEGNGSHTSNNEMRLKSGTPYVWEDSIAPLKDNGTGAFGKWVRIPFNKTAQYVNLQVDQYFGTIREMVFYGTPIGNMPWPQQPWRIDPNRTFDKTIGTNITFGMGQSQEGTKYDTRLKVNRFYAASIYVLDNQDNFLVPNGMNDMEASYIDRMMDSGVNVFYTMAPLTAPSMINPNHNSGGNYSGQKAIDWQLCVGSKQINGIDICDNVAHLPSAYAHAAFLCKKYAAAYGSRPKPMTYFEVGNENDLKFVNAGYYSPDQLAAFMSAAYDGHENTVTYNGQSVGVKNCGNPMKMVMPGLANMEYEYLKVMAFWFQWNRTDHKFAADVINGHAYPNTGGFQGVGANAVALSPENPVYNLKGVIDTLVYFRNRYAPHAEVVNTESGYDGYEERRRDTTEQWCGSSIYGSSFTHVPPIPGVTIKETHGRWLARLCLLHAASDISWFNQFWLADAFQDDVVCGTFNASGLLRVDTVINQVNVYSKKPAWYYIQTLQNHLTNKKFISQQVTTIGTDTIQVQKYRDVTTPQKVSYVLWCPTSRNISVSNYNFHMDEPGSSIVYEMNTITEVGAAIATSSSQNLTLNINERPIIVDVITNIAINQPPVAHAGPDVTITLPVNTVNLNGTGTDADGTITAYQWTKIAGPNGGNIVNANLAATLVDNLAQGVYKFEFVVTDNSGATGKDTLVITVNPPLVLGNAAPVAHAGTDTVISLPATSALLNGSGTDIDGTITAYRWAQISGPSNSHITNADLSGTSVTSLIAGMYQFELTVTDNGGATAKDTMQVIVNQPPVANAGADVIITLPVNTTPLVGSANDVDGTVVSYLWTKVAGPSAGTIANPATLVTAANNLVQGVYQFELLVTDNYGATKRDTMQVIVNQPPVANAGADVIITLPVNTAALNGSANDVDGTVVSYQWTKVAGPSAGTIANPATLVTAATNLVQGVYKFELLVTDNYGATKRDTMQVTVNQPPVANAGTDVVITLPVNTTPLVGSANDVDGTVVSYLWTKVGGPSAGTIANPATLVTAATNLVQGVYQFELLVTDNYGATKRDTMQVTVNPAMTPVNQPPVAHAGVNANITLPANTIGLTGSGTDTDGTITSYQWTKISGPASGTIVNAALAITSVTNLVQGVYKFELTVTDNNGATGKDTMQVTVNTAMPVNKPPVANAGTDITVVLPTNFATLTGSGTDPDGTVVGYSWKIISGAGQATLATPNAAQSLVSNLTQGVYLAELTVTDNSGATGKDTVLIAVGSSRLADPVVENAKVYPNPAKGIVTVEMNSPATGRALSMIVLDARGTIVFKKDLTIIQHTQLEKIDMTSFPAGTYLIRLAYDNKIQIVKKIVKM